MKKRLVILSIFLYLLLFCFKNKLNADEILATFNGQILTICEFDLLCQVPIKYGIRPITRAFDKIMG